MIAIDERDVLLVVDMQNDFMPGGALAVAEGDAIVPLINRLAESFANVVLTQDWHPAGHASFASSHPGKKPFDTIAMPYGEQVLWPDHCVQGSPGAALHKDLAIDHAILILAQRLSIRASIPIPPSPRPIARRRPALPASCGKKASAASSPAGSPPIIASAGRRSTRAPKASRPSSSRTPAARSTPTARSRAPGRRWRRPG